LRSYCPDFHISSSRTRSVCRLARFDQAHCTLPHLGRMLERPAHDSILLKNWSLHHKPGAVHEASPNTSAATASTRNADGKPNEE
jgi:hypothetical protein